jgi:hypothetical protein
MKSRGLLAAALAAAILSSCQDKSAEPQTGARSDFGTIVTDLPANIEIGYKETVFIESERLHITFNDFSDSRCPIGARCIWEGEAIVELLLVREESDSAYALPVSRPGLDPDRFTWLKAYALDYRITLIHLEPYPVVGEDRETSSYSISIYVERIIDPTDCDHVNFIRSNPTDLCEDEVVLGGAVLEDDLLKLPVKYTGGCGGHDFMLVAQPYFMESYPVQINLYLRHKNLGDFCEAVVGDTICFDVRRIGELYEGVYGKCDDIILNIYDCCMDDPEERFSVVLRR